MLFNLSISEGNGFDTGVYKTRIYCTNCLQFSDVVLPYGSIVNRSDVYHKTPTYTYNEQTGFIICGHCGAT